jgi:hypothetical protein
MTRLIHNDNDNDLVGVPHAEIDLFLVKVSEGKYIWRYSHPQIITKSLDLEIVFNLKFLGDFTPSIQSFASTGFDGVQSPLSIVKKSDNSITLKINIKKNQIIDIGLFIKVSEAGHPKVIFCDPQASNDPEV